MLYRFPAGATFGDKAAFTDAAFGAGVSFFRAAFGESALFTGAVFDYLASFNGATFGDWADFTAATFNDANFTGAAFGNRAFYTGAAFGGVVRFDDTFFKGSIELTGQSEEEWRRGLENITYGVAEEVRVALTKPHVDPWKHNSSGPDRFLTISFANARFDGEAVFSGRTFVQAANFTNARFYSPPIFDNVTNASRIDFTGAHIGFVPPGKRPWTKYWTKDKGHPKNSKRNSKKSINKKGMSGRSGGSRSGHATPTGSNSPSKLRGSPPISSGSLSWASTGHFPITAATSCCAWIFVSVFIFHFWYALILAPLKQKVDPANKDYYDQAVWMLALGNAVPFVGHLSIDAGIKKSLYCPGDVLPPSLS